MTKKLYYEGEWYELICQGSPKYHQQQKDIDFWLSLANEYGQEILELACGTGRVTIPLFQAKYSVIGMDYEDSMLNLARKKEPKISWIKGNVTNFNLNTKFSLIIFPYNSLSHIYNYQDIESTFYYIRQHLTKNGYFILDIKNPNPDYIYRIHNQNQRDFFSYFLSPEDNQPIVVTRLRSYNSEKQIYLMKLFYNFLSNQIETNEIIEFRLFYPQEIEALLHFNGFKIIKKFGDYSMRSFSSNSPKQLILCQKN